MLGDVNIVLCLCKPLLNVSRWVPNLCWRYRTTPESSDHLTSTTSQFASCLWTTRRPAPATPLLRPLAPASTSARTPKWFWVIQRRMPLHTSTTWPCTTWRLGAWCVLSAWRTCAQTRESWWRTSLSCRRASLRPLTASRRGTDKHFLWSCRGNYKSSSKIRKYFDEITVYKCLCIRAWLISIHLWDSRKNCLLCLC